MSKYKFVGFQEHIEIPEGFEPLNIHHEITSGLRKGDAFAYLCVPAKLSQWFFATDKFESKTGGKITFQTPVGEDIAVCTGFVIEQSVALVSDLFGNLLASVEKAPEGSKIILDFKLLTDSSAEKIALIEPRIEALRELLACG